MHFLLVLLSAVAMVSAVKDVPIQNPNPQQRAGGLKLLDLDGDKLTNCASDDDCSADKERPVCDTVMKLCKPQAAPTFELESGPCADDSACKASYVCQSGKCHFVGPKPCNADSDCLQGGKQQFTCSELKKSAPGKRCYAKCEEAKDCHQCDGDKCRFPSEAREKISCCKSTGCDQKLCLKKVACEA